MNFLKRNKCSLTNADIENLTCFFYNESNSLLATAFFNFPLPLKRHCVQVGVVAGQIARHVPEKAIPKGMDLDEYANAVRYGCLYHDIGAYLVYNQQQLYPTAGERFLREELGDNSLSPAARQIMLEIVHDCCEQYDGQGYPDRISGDAIPLHAGICAIANRIDDIISARRGNLTNAMIKAKKFVCESCRTVFSPGAVNCFLSSYADIIFLYQHWRKSPPFWKNDDIKPLAKSIDRNIG